MSTAYFRQLVLNANAFGPALTASFTQAANDFTVTYVGNTMPANLTHSRANHATYVDRSEEHTSELQSH